MWLANFKIFLESNFYGITARWKQLFVQQSHLTVQHFAAKEIELAADVPPSEEVRSNQNCGKGNLRGER